LLDLTTIDLDGVSLADRIGDGSHFVDRRIIRAFVEPVSPVGGLVALFETEARCMVFDGLEDLANRVDDPALDVTAQDILVLKHVGPRSPSGMPEAGYLPIPKKLARAGVKDMVRMSDCRMSGTAFGTIVLHIAPEAAVGGPLALVQTGDRIRLSVKDRKLDLLVAEDEMARRRAAWQPAPAPKRGWDKLVYDQVTQAPLGADLAFLRAAP
jgi:dihydroxy-acid dehydratase